MPYFNVTGDKIRKPGLPGAHDETPELRPERYEIVGVGAPGNSSRGSPYVSAAGVMMKPNTKSKIDPKRIYHYSKLESSLTHPSTRMSLNCRPLHQLMAAQYRLLTPPGVPTYFGLKPQDNYRGSNARLGSADVYRQKK